MRLHGLAFRAKRLFHNMLEYFANQREGLMKKSLLALAIIAGLLTGCAATERLKQSGIEAMRTIADKKLDLAERLIQDGNDIKCDLASIGALARKYKTEDQRKQWAEDCENGELFVPW